MMNKMLDFSIYFFIITTLLYLSVKIFYCIIDLFFSHMGGEK